jgi:hypothetical protein
MDIWGKAAGMGLPSMSAIKEGPGGAVTDQRDVAVPLAGDRVDGQPDPLPGALERLPAPSGSGRLVL